MSGNGHYWDHHVSKATKIAVARVLGSDQERMIAEELRESAQDIERRREEARKQCAERRARREDRGSSTTTEMKTETLTKLEAVSLGYRPATNGYLDREKCLLDRELARLRAARIDHCLVECKRGIAIWKKVQARVSKVTPSVMREYGTKARPLLLCRRRASV